MQKFSIFFFSQLLSMLFFLAVLLVFYKLLAIMFYSPFSGLKPQNTKSLNNNTNIKTNNTKLCYIILDGMRFDTFRDEILLDIQNINDINNINVNETVDIFISPIKSLKNKKEIKSVLIGNINNNRNKFENFFYKSITDIPTSTVGRLKQMISGQLTSFNDILTTFKHDYIGKDNMFHNYSWSHQKNVITYEGDITSIDLIGKDFINEELHKKKSKTVYTKQQVELLSLNPLNTIKAYSPDKNDEKLIMLTSLLNLSVGDFNFVHLNCLDSVGHKVGCKDSSNNYLKEYKALIDDYKLYLKLVVLMLDKDKSLYVTSDHGVNDDGSHGGGERLETESFLYLLKPDCSCITNNNKNSEIRQGQILNTVCGQHDIKTPYPSMENVIDDDIYCGCYCNKENIKEIITAQNTADNIKKYHRICKINKEKINEEIKLTNKELIEEDLINKEIKKMLNKQEVYFYILISLILILCVY